MEMERKVKMLADVKKVLDKNNIEFFPIYGTLLGFVRDKQIIPWDVDIDLGAWHHDYKKVLALRKDFNKLGYDMGDSGLLGDYCHLSIFYKKEGPYAFHAGISFWVKDNDKAVNLKFYDNNLFFRKFGRFKGSKFYNFFAPIYRSFVLYINKQEVLPYSWFEEMKTVNVHDMDFKIPSESEEYISRMYGENWKTPEKKWSKKKHLKYNSFRTRYKIQDQKVKDLWIKREDINSDL